MEYYTEEDIRQAIEKILRRRIAETKWDIVKYSVLGEDAGAVHLLEEDLNDFAPIVKMQLEALEKLYQSVGTRILSRTGPSKSKTLGNAAIIFTEYLRRHRLSKHPEVIGLLSEAESCRKDLGLSQPIPLSRIGEWLVKRGASYNPTGHPIPYPTRVMIKTCEQEQVYKEAQEYIDSRAIELGSRVSELKKEGYSIKQLEGLINKGISQIRDGSTEFVLKGLRKLQERGEWWMSHLIEFWDVNYVFTPLDASANSFFDKLLDYLTTIALVKQCHPALGLACVLSNLPLFPTSHPKLEIIRDGENIQLFLNSPYVPTKVLTYVYTQVRNFGIRERKGIQGERARPRSPNRRIRLYEFCQANSELSWEARFRKWKRAFPKWEYSSIQTMRTAYYKAKTLITEKTKGG